MDSFTNRTEAGALLAEEFGKHAGRFSSPLVLGLPRGGVPVAAAVARALDAELDILTVRKVGVPGQPELAMGALASGDIRVRNERVIRGLGVSEDSFNRVARNELEELQRRETRFRGERPRPSMRDRTVILVDDGVATGSTMRAAIQAVRQQDPREVIVAVPVAAPDSLELLRDEADDVICLMAPAGFAGVGQWYRDFAQTADEEVQSLLAEAWGEC
ncbi:phosphoribosyltransferase [Marinobacteraceae bacterium S3BR75-40.1]